RGGLRGDGKKAARAAATRLNGSGRIAHIDPGNGAHRKARRPAADRGGKVGESGNPDRRIGVGFRAGWKHAANPDIVEQIERRRFRLRGILDGETDNASAADETAHIFYRHVILAHMDAVGTGGKRHVHAVIDDKRHAISRKRRFDGARILDHGARAPLLVAKLHERCAALGHHAGKLVKLSPARMFGVEQCVEAQIQLHQASLARASNISRSSFAKASTIATAKLPGPRANSAAHSPAMAKASSPAALASQASGSTARKAPVRAVPAHPMPATCAMSTSPLAIFTMRPAPPMRSVAPVSATIAPCSRA